MILTKMQATNFMLNIARDSVERLSILDNAKCVLSITNCEILADYQIGTLDFSINDELHVYTLSDSMRFLELRLIVSDTLPLVLTCDKYRENQPEVLWDIVHYQNEDICRNLLPDWRNSSRVEQWLQELLPSDSFDYNGVYNTVLSDILTTEQLQSINLDMGVSLTSVELEEPYVLYGEDCQMHYMIPLIDGLPVCVLSYSGEAYIGFVDILKIF